MFIYALVDPQTDLVRYVGYSKHPDMRLRSHAQDEYNLPKREWICELRSRGCRPSLVILEQVTLENRSEREVFWISVYRQLGAPLLNIANGGVGRTCGLLTWADYAKHRPGAHQERVQAMRVFRERRQREIQEKEAARLRRNEAARNKRAMAAIASEPKD